MRSKWAVLLAAAVVSATAIVISLVTVSGAIPGGRTVHVIEHPVNEGVSDADGDGTYSEGDIYWFSNPVFDEADNKQVGHDSGMCILEVPKKGSWACTWTTFLPGGQITVSGPFFDTRESVLAIIGGTGDYSTATGNMQLEFHKGGEYDFIFRLGA